MEKLFGQYPGNRSSTNKYDPCSDLDNKKSECEDCRFFTIADPFVSDEFMRKVMKNKYEYPYVLITETVGCNLRCWFCYSHHCWSKKNAEEKEAKPVYLSPEKLAEQARCKIERISKSDDMENRPFARLRITGGEPIYSNDQVLRPFDSEKNIDYKLGLDYWLNFIVNMNEIFRDLLSKNQINFALNSEWDKRAPFPTFLGDSDGRINIRFDTNGVAYSNSQNPEDVFGGKEVANHLVDKVYKLYEKGLLSNVKIWITYSLKGITKNEYYWSQSKNLPCGEDNIGEFDLKEHPQYSGIMNIKNRIDSYKKVDQDFEDVIDITVEKGIDHDVKKNVYLYNREALDWNKFEKKSNIKLSTVKNNINLIYRYEGDTWGILQRTPGLAKRYFNHGAEIEAKYEGGNLVGKETYGEAKKLSRFMHDHYHDEDFHVLIRPKEK